MSHEQYPSIGKKVKGRKNKDPHITKIGLNLSNADMKKRLEELKNVK
jgi:hypothetical protein